MGVITLWSGTSGNVRESQPTGKDVHPEFMPVSAGRSHASPGSHPESRRFESGFNLFGEQDWDDQNEREGLRAGSSQGCGE